MTVRNPTFEDAGSLPGHARHWTLQTHCALERIAAFGTSPPRAWEGFGRWRPLFLRLADVSAAHAFPSGPDDFDGGWGVAPYLMEFPPAQLAAAPLEDYESDWRSDDYSTAWNDVQADAAPTEPFESGWRSNESFAWAWGDVAAVALAFTEDPHVGPTDIELFESGWSAASTI